MVFRFRISILILTMCLTAIAASTPAANPVAGPGIQTPDRFTPDSARIRNPEARARNERLYDSIQSKTSRRAVPRMLYKMLFVRPVLDTTSNGQVLAYETGQEPLDILIRTMTDVGTDNQRINFDPANLLYYNNEDPMLFVDALGDKMVHMHCKDAVRPVPGEVFFFLTKRRTGGGRPWARRSKTAAFFRTPQKSMHLTESPNERTTSRLVS